MKKITYFKTLLIIVAALICVTTAAAQETKTGEAPPSAEKRPPAYQQYDMRTNMLKRLGLAEEQIKQIQTLNAEKRPLMGEAQRRLREATQALDEAIYADQVNENDIQTRLKEVQLAQAEVGKLRYMNELAVRRILTAEQLVRFREMRQRFEKKRQDFEQRRRFNVERQRPGKEINPSQDGQPPQQRYMRRDKQKPVI